MQLHHGRTTVYNVNYHIVWSVKYRRAVLLGRVEKRLKTLLNEIAADKGFKIATMDVMPDRVHVFVSGASKDICFLYLQDAEGDIRPEASDGVLISQ